MLLQESDHHVLAREGKWDSEHSALHAACEQGVALCTIVGIDGSFSRRVGAQLAIHPNGAMTGALSDGCLERQLASDTRDASKAVVKRYGRGSPLIDFRLPCGGGLDILIDPAPDRLACRKAVFALADRKPASLTLAHNERLKEREYIPALRIWAFGEGPELGAFQSIAEAAGIMVATRDTQQLSLNRAVANTLADRWTAVVLLFHDYEWEAALLRQIFDTPAFYIGAQGGETARINRVTQLLSEGVSEEQLACLRSPIGTIPACRTPGALALSILSEIVGEYEKLQPHP